jgi:pimeloyl-ACP methyl ester carboxylesterase
MTSCDFVASKDGTSIYLQACGAGPGLVLVHGGMQTSGDMARLADHMADAFTVYSITRRGRRPSGPFGDGYGMSKEVEDLNAVLSETGSGYVFGLSSGALIALRAALANPSIAKIALYEPPIEIAGATPSPLACVPAYEEAIAANDKARALVAILKALDDPSSLMARTPRFLLETMFRLSMNAKAPGGEMSFGELIPTMHYDLMLAREMADTVECFRGLPTEVLLLGGNRSRSFLATALNALAGVLPCASRVCLEGVGHVGPADAPERVAHELKRFLAAGV